MKRNFKQLLLIGFIASGYISCTSSGDNPGIEYAPDMYVSKGYEPFSQVTKSPYNPNGMTMRLPVSGSIARGQLNFVYPFPNNAEGYEASAAFASWVPFNEENLAEGERLYNVYCWNCHGKTGGNDGPVIAGGKFPPPPWANYQSDYIKTLPNGKIYHTITFGKGLMGSHASVLSPDERWKVIGYVKSLSLGKGSVSSEATPVTSVDSTATAVTDNTNNQ